MGYDVIISSSHAVVKGVLTKADQLHICYFSFSSLCMGYVSEYLKKQIC